MGMIGHIYSRRKRRFGIDYPNEPGWNGALISFGSGIFIVIASIAAILLMMGRI